MRVVSVSDPTVEPLTATEAKARLGVGSDVSDDTVNAYVKAARQMIDGWDGWLGRALVSQQWRLLFDAGFPCERIAIPLPPLIRVDSVKYIDRAGVQQTLPADQYQVRDGEPAAIVPAFGRSWPVTRNCLNAVEVEFTAGYGAAGNDVPEPIRSAIALQVRKLLQLAQRDASLTQRIVFGVSSRSWAADGGAAGAAALDLAVTSLLSTYRVYA